MGIDMSHNDSSRVSWTTCPICGGQLAIGWDKLVHQAREVPVEFDCVNHCQLTVNQEVRAATEPSLGDALRGPINGRD